MRSRFFIVYSCKPRRIFQAIIVLVFTFCSLQGEGQLILSQDFESAWTTASTLSPAWSSVGTGNNQWQKNNYTTGWSSSSGSYTPGGIGSCGTTGSARFHSYDAASASTGDLITPTLNFSATGTKYLSFWMINTSGSDKIEISLSTDNGSSYGAVLGTYFTYGVWTSLTVTLGTSTSAQCKIRFRATSDFGTTDIGVDKVTVYNGSNAMNGTFTIDNSLPASATNYTCFTTAVTDLNQRGISGPVVLNVTAGQTFTEDVPALTAIGTSTNTIIFQRAGAGANPVIRPTGGTGGSDAGFTLAGADYITLDGIDINIASGSAVEYGYYITLTSTTNGAQNNTLKNVKVTLNRSNTSSIGIYQFTTTATSAAGANSGNKYYNFIIENCYNGIYLLGTSAFPDINNEIGITGGGTTIVGGATANDIGNGANTVYGIRVAQQQDVKIFNCEVRNLNGTSTSNVMGIYLETSKGSNTQIYNNQVHDIRSSSTSTSPVVYGIRADVSSGNTAFVYNNFVYGLTHTPSSASSTQTVRGIAAHISASTGTANFYYNSVRIATSSANTSSTAFYMQSGTVNLKNNIFSNFSPGGATSKRYAIFFSSGTLNSSDYNDLYTVTGTNNFTGYSASTDRVLLTDWRTATSRDANSIAADPQFISATNLHINSSFNAVDGKGNEIGGYTTDIDGNSRCASGCTGLNIPDIGADEYVYVAPACPTTPTALSAGSVTTTGVSVSFTCSSCTGTFVLEYGAPGFTPGTGATAGGGTVVTGSSSPIVLSGLSANTSYDVYIRNNCSGSNFSLNSIKLTFTTLCGNYTVPYFENFDAVTVPALPACMSIENSNADAYVWQTCTATSLGNSTAIAPNSGNNQIGIRYNTSAAMNDWFYLPGINLTGGQVYRVSFYVRGYTGLTEQLEVKYGNNANSISMTSNLIAATNITGGTPYAQMVADFTPAADGVYFIGFHGISVTNQWYLFIDDISVTVSPFNTPCNTPSEQPVALNLTNITSTGLTGNFTAATPAPTGYIILRGTVNVAPTLVNGSTYTAGNSYTLGGNSYTVVSNGSSTSFTETTLSSNTTYYYFIYSFNGVCGGAPFYLNTSPLTGNALTCTAAPATLTGASASSSSATISFGTVTGAIQYILQYSVAGANAWITASPAPTTSPYTLNGLAAGTTYDIRLQGPNSNCGTLRTTTNAFNTACTVISTLPWSEKFDGMSTVGTGIVPPCWLQVAGIYSFVSGDASYTSYHDPYSAPNYITIRWSNTTASHLWTPGFQLTAGVSYDFSFRWAGDGYSGWTGDVLYNSTQNASGATTLGNFVSSGTVTSTAYTLRTFTFTPSSTGVYYFATRVSSNSTPFYLGLDDYSLKVTPPCNFAGTASAATNSICGGSGSTTLSAVNYSVSGAGLSYQWEVSSDNISFTDLAGQTNPASATTGTITATRYYRLRVFCTALGNNYSNTVSVNVGSYAITGTTPSTRCGVGTVTLQATASPGSSISWYSSPTGGIPLGSGSSFITPEISATTNYYVGANNGVSSASIGATYAGSNNNSTNVGSHGIVITTTSPNIVIVSAAIPFTGKGTFTIQLQTAAGAVVSSVTTDEYTGGASIPVAIPLNLAVPTPGTYRLLITAITGTIDELGYISNAVYPYSGLGGAFAVTAGYWYGNDSNDNMYLFSLVVTDVCESARTLVTATVTPPPALTISSTAATICSGSSTNINVTSTLANFSTYSWAPAAGATAGGDPTGSTVSLNPISTTNYTLTATSASGCVNKASALITVNAAAPTTTGAAVCSGTNATISATSACGSFGNPTLQINGSWNAASDPVALRPIIYIANSTTCLFDDVVTRNYTVQDFQVTVTGTYTFVMPNTTAFDGMGYIVTGPFIPGTCSGGGTWIVGDDDSGPTTFEPLMTATLTAGVTYTLITTTYSASSGTVTDNYTWNITGPVGGAVTTVSGGTLQWYTVPSGGSSISSASPFNPVGVAGSGIASNTSVGSYTFYAACSNNPTCRTATGYVIGAAGQWIGASDKVWSNIANWCGGVPTLSTDAVISLGAPNMPLIGTGTGSVLNLTVNNGASLTINNATLQIAGSITATNTIDAAAGTIEMAGASTQALSGSAFTGRNIRNLIASNSVNVSAAANDSLRITGVLSFGNVNSKTFNSGNNVILVSDANTTARVADITNNGANSGNSFSGSFVVQRYMPPHRSWRLMTAPIAAGAQTINQAWQESVGGNWSSNPYPGYGTHVTGGTARTTVQGFDQGPMNASIYGYSGTNWNYLPATTGEMVTSREGWMLFVRGSRAINLPLSNTGTVADVTILRPKGALRFGTQSAITNAAGGFTVVGNPYACPLDFKKLTRSGVIGGVGGNAFYMWDPYLGGSNGVGAFVTLAWNGSSYDKTIVTGGGSSSLGTEGIIPSSAAIMVNLSPGGSIGIAEDDKDTTVYGNSFAFRPAGNRSSIRTTLYAYLADGERALSDGTLVNLDEQAATELDPEDAIKINNFNENIAQYREGKRIAIERRGQLGLNDTLFYHTWNLRQRGYELEISPTRVSLPAATVLMLEDRYLNRKTPVMPDDTTRVQFTVTSDAGSSAADRFRLLVEPAAVVPVSFLEVQAVQQDADVQVSWTVGEELNLAYYTIEHATDPASFSGIGEVMATGGRLPYAFTHLQPATGIHYYRIRSTDRSGAVQYSRVVKVIIRSSGPSVTVYPNPVKGSVLQVLLHEQPAGRYELQLFNSAGQQVYRGQLQHPGGRSAHTVKLPRKPAAGSYELILHGKKRMVVTVMVE